jgi:hypothetical protein
MNDCAHFLRFSLEENSFVSLIVVLMVGWKLEYLEVEGHKPTESELGMEVDLNCLPL